MPMSTVFESQSSAVQDVRRVVIRDEPTWEAVWAELQGQSTNPVPRPAIDFSRDALPDRSQLLMPIGGL